MDYFCKNNIKMIATDMMSSEEVLQYIRQSLTTVRPVNVKRFAEEIGMNVTVLSMAVKQTPSNSNGKVPTIKMEYLLRATQIIQELEKSA